MIDRKVNIDCYVNTYKSQFGMKPNVDFSDYTIDEIQKMIDELKMVNAMEGIHDEMRVKRFESFIAGQQYDLCIDRKTAIEWDFDAEGVEYGDWDQYEFVKDLPFGYLAVDKD